MSVGHRHVELRSFCIGFFAMVFTISLVSTSFVENPKNIYAPLIASLRVLNFVSMACADFHWLRLSLPLYKIPFVSNHIQGTPRNMQKKP